MNLQVTPPPYPLGAFPALIKDAAEEVWSNTQAPDALVGMEILMAMSVSAQALYDVRSPTGQVRPVSLNLLIVADSGERKTAVHDLVAKPLYAFDAARMKKYESDLQNYESQHSIWKSIDVGLRRALTKLTQQARPTDDARHELSAHAKGRPSKPRARRIMRQNMTERAIMDSLAGDGESMAFVSDEAEIIIKGGLLRLTGLLNKVWDGAQTLSLDRSDGVILVSRQPRGTLSMAVQSQVFQALLDKRGATMRGSGHWARYLMGCPASTQGTRYTYNLEKASFHLPRFHQRIRELLDDFGRRVDAGQIERIALEFSDEAIPLWVNLANQIEVMLLPCGFLHDIKDFASKALELAARVAALLHIFSNQSGKISVDTLNRAVTIVDWHLYEFKRIFSPPEIPQEHADAQLLEQYLRSNYWYRHFSFAQRNLVLRSGPIRSASRLDAALNCLTAAGCVWSSVGSRRERYINLHPNYFGPMGGAPTQAPMLPNRF